jgi:hypothetical protein
VNWRDPFGLQGEEDDKEEYESSEPFAGLEAQAIRQEIRNIDPSWMEIRNSGTKDTGEEVRFLREQLNQVRNRVGCDHFRQRREEAKYGDTNRQIGDHNRTIREGSEFVDRDTGNTVYVRGNKVVITSPTGKPVSQFKNARNNTLRRILEGKWVPK